MMPSAIVQVSELSKSFNSSGTNLEVLKDINFSIQKSTITGFIGKSGAGKSTLMRCLNLLERPTSGSIWINGCDMTHASPNDLKKVRQKTGIVFQSLNLLQHQSVRKNIALPLQLIGVEKREITKKVEEISTLVGLQDKLDNFPSQLSGGQKQRIAIARALITDADILLCDEFTSALDPQTTFEILNLIKEVNARLGVTVILISHDMFVIREICDYVYVMEAGRIIENGSVAEVLYSPQQGVTRSLIGSMLTKEIPVSLRQKLQITPTQNSKILLRLVFTSTSTQTALMSEAAIQFNTPINIVAGQLDHLNKSTFGNLIVSLNYSPSLYSQMESYLYQNKVSSETLGFF